MEAETEKLVRPAEAVPQVRRGRPPGSAVRADASSTSPESDARIRRESLERQRKAKAPNVSESRVKALEELGKEFSTAFLVSWDLSKPYGERTAPMVAVLQKSGGAIVARYLVRFEEYAELIVFGLAGVSLATSAAVDLVTTLVKGRAPAAPSPSAPVKSYKDGERVFVGKNADGTELWATVENVPTAERK